MTYAIIALVLVLAIVLVIKNKKAPEVLSQLEDIAISKIEQNKDSIITDTYDNLPDNVKNQIGKELYVEIAHQLVNASLDIIKNSK